MNVSELHPEEALDLYEAGRLGPRELEALKAHLVRCPSCAAHVQWRSDIEIRLSSAGDVAEARRLAAEALARRGIAPPVRAEDRPATSGRRWTMVAAVVAISLVSGAASAKLWPSIERAWKRLSEPARPASTPRRTPRQLALSPATGAGDKVSPPPPTTEPAIATRPLASSPRRPATFAPPRRRSPAPSAVAAGGVPAPSSSRAASPGPSAPVTVEESPLPAVDPSPLDRPASAPPPASASRLFADVAQARRAGWMSEAHQAYGALATRFAGSREERTASVLLGQLTLERGEPTDALARFEGYLGTDPGGALAEEARLGRALALEQLGHRDDARRAWQELLQKHPRSLHAARARARLESLPALPSGRQDPRR